MGSKVKIKRKSRLLPILVVILLVLAIIDDYQGWRLLLLVFGGVWLTAKLWARSMATNLHLKREMRFGWAQVGDRLEERFTLINKSRLPGIWVAVEDHSDIPDYQAGVVTGVEAGSSNQWRIQGICSRRGLFSIGPTTMRTGDPLGLYTVEQYKPQSTTLMVTPPIVPLPEIEVAPGGRAGQGRPRQDAPERTVSATGVREYVPGDNLRWIHWRTSARKDDFYVRLFESTPAGDWWIILDLEQGIQAGEGANSTEEHGVVLAASLADRGLRMGRSVGLAAYGEPFVWLPPKEGDGQRWEILRSLALLSPTQHSLVELLTAIRRTLGRYTSLVIITPNTNGSWLESLLPLLWQEAVPTVLLLDPKSFGGRGDTRGIIEELSKLSIHRYVITPGLLNRPEAQPGRKGQWEWRISPTGRAIPVTSPSETPWKALA